MFKPYKTTSPELSDEDIEKQEIAYWAFNSHYWIEHTPGYYECKFCKVNRTNQQPISFEHERLCKSNPIFKREINVIEEQLKLMFPFLRED